MPALSRIARMKAVVEPLPEAPFMQPDAIRGMPIRMQQHRQVVDGDNRAVRMNERQNVRGRPEHVGRAREHFVREARVGPEAREGDGAEFKSG